MITSGTPGTGQLVPDAFMLNGVGCTSATTCQAVGTSSRESFLGQVVPIISGTPGSPGTVVLGTLDGVACLSATTCQAVGTTARGDVTPGAGAANVGSVRPIINGAPGPQQLALDTLSFFGAACPDATACLAVGGGVQMGDVPGGGVVVGITNGAPGTAQRVPGTFQLSGVACASASNCLAVGKTAVQTAGSSAGQGVVVPIVNGVAGTAQVVPGTGGLSGVACPSAISHSAISSSPITCQAVGNNSSGGVVVTIVNGVPGLAQVVPGTTALNGVACPSAITCQAVGNSPRGGVAVSIVNGVPGLALAVPQSTQLNGVACPSTETCQAVGYYVSSSSADSTPPMVSITTPADGASYGQGATVNADYACADEPGGSGLKSCTGPVATGQPVDTSNTGLHSFTVTATDNSGNTASKTVKYTVVAAPSTPAGTTSTASNTPAVSNDRPPVLVLSKSKVVIGHRFLVRILPSGRERIRLVCPITAQNGCSGTLQLLSRFGKSKTSHYALTGGQSHVYLVHPSQTLLRYITTHRTEWLTVKVLVTDTGQGHATTSQRTIHIAPIHRP